ncbi:MAG: phospho-N-acetylmuramoyl-pentapeptide-transferase [Candidatus Omnitrophota bacterium]|nr:phospho-N-acetylmuramoyl-pentapeptide-transferase [Candidatus Omnitrophota bacterium]
MLYFLHPLKDVSIFFNLFRYITFRAAGASITAFLLCLLLGPMMIRWLKQVNALTHNKREYAESLHALYEHKNDVPTMGGILMVVAVMMTMLLWADLTNRFSWILMIAITGFGALGFLDDWIKLQSRSSRGLSSLTKLCGQLVMAIALGVYLYLDPQFDHGFYLPFLKRPALEFSAFFIPFVVLVLVGSSNALNLTDGLDGLAVGCTLFTVGSFAIISYLVGRIDYAAYLSIPHVRDSGEITVFCSALVGASAGFLWFNSYPAEVMMGDTGSLALGGAIGTVAVLTKKEAVLLIVGGVFAWEALSVILQVASFKLFRKRIFLMSPFHHHLQLKGWPESKVTIRLWIISLILAVIGLSTLKVR